MSGRCVLCGLVVVLMFFVLGGCAPPQFVIPENRTQTDYKRDLDECEYKARLLYKDSVGVPFVVLPEGIALAVREEWKRCMESRGYIYVQE